MAYAPLFYEVHSELFLALCRIINAIAAGTRMTRADILQQLPNLDWGGLERANALIDTLFLFQPDGSACLFLDNGIAARATTAELVWLRAMLDDPGAAFLLPDDLREKHQLAYANRDSSGQIHEGICSPCRLEYDAAANCYYLIIWQPDEARAIKMRVARLASVQCLDAPIPASTEEAFHQFLADRRQSVTLRIERQNNAVERSFMMFASYDKEASYDEEADTYTIQLYYYDFDRREILQQILSLGAAATVLAPADMREAIIERLKAAWQNLQ